MRSVHIKRFLILCREVLLYWKVNRYLKKIKQIGRMTVLVELQTTNELFYLKPVLEKLHSENTFLIFFSREKVAAALRELLTSFFPVNTPKLLNIFWIHKFTPTDFYISATQSYDVEVPKNAKYRVNFPHTITSKGRADVFSATVEKFTDSFNAGPAYFADLTSFCKEKGLKNVPRMHAIGSPKSDGLFNHTIERKKFLLSHGLDPELKTIMYAPTWNQDASLPLWCNYILEVPEKFNVNLIIKIHPGMYIDPLNKKSSGGVDWKTFLSKKEFRKKRIINAYHEDSPDYIMATDVAATDISTIWIEFYFLRKSTIFLDVPEFFKNYGFNSLGDFRQKYGHVVKNFSEFDRILDDLLSGAVQKKDVYDIDNLLLYNKGHGTEFALSKLKELYET